MAKALYYPVTCSAAGHHIVTDSGNRLLLPTPLGRALVENKVTKEDDVYYVITPKFLTEKQEQQIKELEQAGLRVTKPFDFLTKTPATNEQTLAHKITLEEINKFVLENELASAQLEVPEFEGFLKKALDKVEGLKFKLEKTNNRLSKLNKI